MLITGNYFINSNFYCILWQFVSKFLAVYRKLLFGICYSYYKANYSKTAYQNKFEIMPEDFCRMEFLNLMFQGLHRVKLKQTHLRCQDSPSNT